MDTFALRKPHSFGRWLKVYKLYLSAFPAAERKPFFVIAKMYQKGKMEIWCREQNGTFSGLAITINSDDLIRIDYLAVCKHLSWKN